VGVARPEERRDEVSAVAVEDEQRMVHVLAVIAVVIRTFLFSVGGIIGRVEVQKHSLWGAVLFSSREVEFEEDFGYPVARVSCRCVLHPTDGRLTRKDSSTLGKRATHQLEQRIFSKSVRVVLILIATRNLKDALPNERDKGVPSSPLSLLRHVFGDGLAQAQLGVHPRKPQEPAV
jgi:hypothetical protein